MVKHNLYTKIFRQLRGYFISPHLNVWRELRKRLFNKGFPDNTSQLKDFIKEPPPELFEQVLEKHEQLQSLFSQLKDYEQKPGEHWFQNVQSLIQEERKQVSANIRSIPFYKKMIAAAALLFGLISCFLILKITSTVKKEAAAVIVSQPSPVVADTLLSNDPSENIFFKEKSLAYIPAQYPKAKKYFNASNYLSFSEVSIGGNKMPVEDNDLLYSFTKYPYRFGEPNPWNSKKETVVTINSYTGINISPYMSSVISDLYRVKRNGRATAKARKAKLKINRWRKTDIKRFDRKKIKNPLDIIDLGENVFK